MIRDKRWHASEMYDVLVRPTELGESILSAVWMPHLAMWSMWCLVKDRSDRTLSVQLRRVPDVFGSVPIRIIL